MTTATPRDSVAQILARNNVLLAPMAGITEAPFRGICKRMGAGLTYTEMISVKGLHYNRESPASQALLSFSADEVPCAVQISGSEPEMMAQQAAELIASLGNDIAVIDINMGCPVTKVVKKGEGSALMREPELAAKIVSAVVEACGEVPVTVKIRKGWDDESLNAVEFARGLEAAGAAAIAVHGRTREQFYRGTADWDVVAQVKQAVAVPVIGSGDIFSAADAVAMLDGTGIDAVMVARGAQGNPWIFREARALISEGVELPRPTPFERIDMAREHADALVAFGGERAFVRMRKHVSWYIAEMPGASAVRAKVNDCRSHAELDELLGEYRAYLEGRL